jgi:hypothetical protein
MASDDVYGFAFYLALVHIIWYLLLLSLSLSSLRLSLSSSLLLSLYITCPLIHQKSIQVHFDCYCVLWHSHKLQCIRYNKVVCAPGGSVFSCRDSNGFACNHSFHARDRGDRRSQEIRAVSVYYTNPWSINST